MFLKQYLPEKNIDEFMSRKLIQMKFIKDPVLFHKINKPLSFITVCTML